MLGSDIRASVLRALCGTSIGALGLALMQAGAAAQTTECQDVNSGTANGATTTASGALACGNDASAGGPDNTAVGTRAQTDDDQSSAFGADSIATGYRSTALGFASKATGDTSLAAGVNAAAGGASALALGRNSTASDRATAVGAYATASGGSSFAGGDGAQATGDRAVAVGRNAQATDQDAAAIGNDARAGTLSSAFGANTRAGRGGDGDRQRRDGGPFRHRTGYPGQSDGAGLAGDRPIRQRPWPQHRGGRRQQHRIRHEHARTRRWIDRDRSRDHLAG